MSLEIENWTIKQIVDELLMRNTPIYETEESLKRFSFPIRVSELAEDYSVKIVGKLKKDIHVRDY